MISTILLKTSIKSAKTQQRLSVSGFIVEGLRFTSEFYEVKHGRGTVVQKCRGDWKHEVNFRGGCWALRDLEVHVNLIQVSNTGSSEALGLNCLAHFFSLSLSMCMYVSIHICFNVFCIPMDYTVHGLLQARVLEWVTVPFSRWSSQPRDRTQVSRIADGVCTSWAIREVQEYWSR